MSALTIARRNVALLLVSLASLASVACGGADERPGYAGGDVVLESPVDVATTGSSCERGAVQTCTIWLGKTGDLANCAKGVEVCTESGWSECIDQDTMAENPELYSEMTAPVDG